VPQLSRLLFALAALALTGTAAVAQQPAPAPVAATIPDGRAHLQTAAEALAQDAGEYARRFDVPLDEAERRLRAQEETVALTDQLARTYADRLAGIAVEHAPAFRIVVLLTGTEPVPGQVIRAGAMDVPVVFRTGAAATRAQIVAAIKAHQAEIRAALPHPPGLGVDQRTGELVAIVAASDADLYGTDALTAQIAGLTNVPVRLRVIDRPALDLADPDPAVTGTSVENSAVEGGARVVGVNPADGLRYACTTGFTVTDGTRFGIVTAAHCPDTLALIDTAHRQTPLSFVGQWGWGYQDVQVNVGEGPMTPFFYADTAKTQARAVTRARALASTRAGDFVCHRGERTGYSCSTVELVDFAPAGDLCGGACLPTWVTAAGPTCKGGDSGAPVFAGTNAMGIVKGGSYRSDGSCAFYFYMSTDFLPQGWTLLQQPLPTVQPLPSSE
jgi:hypothetical protein